MIIPFSTKAQNLENLSPLVKTASVLPLVYFSYEQWKTQHDRCTQEITSRLGVGPFIVRSSCKDEDNIQTSSAGAFLTLQNVKKDDISYSIDRVFESYKNFHTFNEVLIQPMLTDVIKSGVAFSHDPNTFSTYFVINWIENSDTDLITSGAMNGNIRIHAHNAPLSLAPIHLRSSIKLIKEVYKIFGKLPCECEFAICKNKLGKEKIWLLQARPLVMAQPPESSTTQWMRLKKISHKISLSMRKLPFIYGEKTIFAVMPDWNPAEIIGIRPKPLALSLYRELITDHIWAYQRHNYGYKNLRSVPLMPNFFGLPYIDVRVSFNSFLPEDLKDSLCEKLINYYIKKLEGNQLLHDKVEFEIIFSCYTLDTPKNLETLKLHNFSENEVLELKSSLINITNTITNPSKSLISSDKKRLSILIDRQNKIIGDESLDILYKIYWLIEDAKRYGTLPFSGLARAGFIAIELLKSLATHKIISSKDYDDFLCSMTTVSGTLTTDFKLLNKNEFLKKYGHLRPGTYDILSPRYDEEPDLYFDWQNKNSKETAQKKYNFSNNQKKQITLILKKNGLSCTAKQLIQFIEEGILLREIAKFYFTQNLSYAIKLISEYGKKLGFCDEELAFTDIDIYKELYISVVDEKRLLQNSIKTGKMRYEESKKLNMPPVICDSNDIFSFDIPTTSPNFITQGACIGNIFILDKPTKIPTNSIIFIPNADPGYDWIFSYQISGLITCWGGINSHMAIRSGEFNIPAAIGIGDTQYEKLAQNKVIKIDCANKIISIIK